MAILFCFTIYDNHSRAHPPPPSYAYTSHRITTDFQTPPHTMRVSLAFAVSCALFGSVYGQTKPNVVIFMPDDLQFVWPEAPDQATVVSKTARKLARSNVPTPNFDRIRSEGAVFERAYAAAPACAPSRFAILTGRYPSRSEYGASESKMSKGNGRVNVGVPQTKITGNDVTKTLQTELKAQGYETIQSGKWHLFPGSMKGGYLGDYDSLVKDIKKTGFTTVASAYCENMDPSGETDGVITWSHNHEWMVETSLKAVTAAVEAEKPFFLYMAPTGPHAPKVKAALFDFSLRATPSGMIDHDPVTTMRPRSEMWDAAAQTNLDQDVAAGIMWVDDMLGAMIDGLEDLEVLDNTFFVVCLDHGMVGKFQLTEGGSRIMQAVRYPAEVAAGTVMKSLTMNTDTAATILELVETTPAYTLDGESWLPSAYSGRQPRKTVPKVASVSYSRAVYVGNWKYWDGALYNLATDSLEKEDLALDAQYADVLEKMKLYLACHDISTALEGAEQCIAPAILNELKE